SRMAVFTSATLAAGMYSVTAQYSGDNSYAASTSPAQSLTLLAPQTITFTGTPVSAAFGSTFPVSATASSGLAVTIVASGVCTLSGGTVTVTSGTGTCTLSASQPGNANYAAAPSVANMVMAQPASQTITFNAIPQQVTGASVPLVATATSGLPVTFASLTSTVCSVSGTTASTMTAGACTIQASQAGNTSYAAATPVTQNFAVSPAAGFTITPIPPQENVLRGDVAEFILRLQSVQGFDGNVKLKCSG